MTQESITRGNDFIIRLDLYQQASADVERSPLLPTDIEGLQVAVKSKFGGMVETAFDLRGDSPNSVFAHLDGKELHNGAYSVELTGTIGGHNIRGAEADVFSICEYNGQQNITFKPFEGEEGGTIPMAFCLLADTEGTTEWGNTLTALKEKVETGEKERVANEKERVSNEKTRTGNELQREINRLYEMFWNADVRGGEIYVDSDGVHLDGQITISTTDGDFDVKADNVMLKDDYVGLAYAGDYHFFARSVQKEDGDFEDHEEITYPEQFSAPIGKFHIFHGTVNLPDSVTPVAGPLYRRWLADQTGHAISGCAAAATSAKDAATKATDAATSANNAATKANTAAIDANTAATKANSSANKADTSAANAQAVADNFNVDYADGVLTISY